MDLFWALIWASTNHALIPSVENENKGRADTVIQVFLFKTEKTKATLWVQVIGLATFTCI